MCFWCYGIDGSLEPKGSFFPQMENIEALQKYTLHSQTHIHTMRDANVTHTALPNRQIKRPKRIKYLSALAMSLYNTKLEKLSKNINQPACLVSWVYIFFPLNCFFLLKLTYKRCARLNVRILNNIWMFGRVLRFCLFALYARQLCIEPSTVDIRFYGNIMLIPQSASVCVHACQCMTMDELWAYHRFTNGYLNDSFSPFHLGRLLFGCLALSSELWGSRYGFASTVALARQDEPLRAQPNMPYLSFCLWLSSVTLSTICFKFDFSVRSFSISLFFWSFVYLIFWMLITFSFECIHQNVWAQYAKGIVECI